MNLMKQQNPNLYLVGKTEKRNMRFIKIKLAMICCALSLLSSVVAQQSSKNTVSGELGAKLDTQMRQLAEKGFSGVVFVAKDGQIALNKGYGLADRESKTSYTADTVFDIGSITKQFTGAAILKLEMQGKLSTDDKISKYFKNVPPDKTDITLHHLLTHSAGLLDGLGEDYDKLTRDEMIKGALASRLQTAPGEKYAYSNLGYSLLAAIIEIVTKKPYEKYLSDNLFKPAGMNETGYVTPKWRRENLAAGYAKDGSRWGTPLDKTWDADGPYWNLRGNGGILSTAGDLYKWHLALAGEKILSTAAKEKYFAPHIKEQPEGVSFYGYGWVTQKTPWGTKMIWHNGGNEVFYADFRRFVDENVVVIVGTNSRFGELQREFSKVLQTIFAAGTKTEK
jgi:CubicO group peptidase (beta-lactamase class C family)